MPVNFFDIAGLYEKNGALQELLDFPLEEEGEGSRGGILRHPLHLNPMVLLFLLTGNLPAEEWYMFSAAEEEREMSKERELFPLHEKEYGKLYGYYCMAEKAAEAILFCGGYAQGSRPVSYL